MTELNIFYINYKILQVNSKRFLFISSLVIMVYSPFNFKLNCRENSNINLTFALSIGYGSNDKDKNDVVRSEEMVISILTVSL